MTANAAAAKVGPAAVPGAREGSPWTGLQAVIAKEMADHLTSVRMRILEILILLTAAGTVEQEAPRRYFSLREPVCVEDGESAIVVFPDRELRIACPWYKPGNSRTGLVPDYHLHETDAWLVFPHELVGLDRDEIRAGKGRLAPLLLGPAG